MRSVSSQDYEKKFLGYSVKSANEHLEGLARKLRKGDSKENIKIRASHIKQYHDALTGYMHALDQRKDAAEINHQIGFLRAINAATMDRDASCWIRAATVVAAFFPDPPNPNNGTSDQRGDVVNPTEIAAPPPPQLPPAPAASTGRRRAPDEQENPPARPKTVLPVAKAIPPPSAVPLSRQPAPPAPRATAPAPAPLAVKSTVTAPTVPARPPATQAPAAGTTRAPTKSSTATAPLKLPPPPAVVIPRGKPEVVVKPTKVKEKGRVGGQAAATRPPTVKVVEPVPSDDDEEDDEAMDIDTPPKPARRAKRIYKSRPMIEDSDEDTSNLPTVTVLRTPAPVKAATKAPPSKPLSSAPQRPHRDAQRPLHPNLAAAARAIEDNESDEDYDGDRIESKDASDGGDDPDVDEKDELGESVVDEEFRPQRKAPRKRSRRPAKPSKPKVPKTPKAVTDAPKACSHCVRKNVRCQIDGPGSACLECRRVKSRCPLSTEQRLQAVEGGLSTLQATTSRIEAKVDWVMDRLSEWMQLFDEYPEDDYDEAIRQKLALRGGVQAQQPATSVRQSPPPQAPPVEEESLEDAIEDAYADAPPETVQEPAEEATGQHEPGDPDEPTTNVTPAAASPRISPPPPSPPLVLTQPHPIDPMSDPARLFDMNASVLNPWADAGATMKDTEEHGSDGLKKPEEHGGQNDGGAQAKTPLTSTAGTLPETAPRPLTPQPLPLPPAHVEQGDDNIADLPSPHLSNEGADLTEVVIPPVSAPLPTLTPLSTAPPTPQAPAVTLPKSKARATAKGNTKGKANAKAATKGRTKDDTNPNLKKRGRDDNEDDDGPRRSTRLRLGNP